MPPTRNQSTKVAHPPKRLHEILFSLNIGFAITYALFVYDGASFAAIHASQGVQDFLGTFGSTLRHIAPLAVNLHTKRENLRSVMIREVAFAVLVLGVALIFYFFVRLFERTATGELIFVPLSAATSFIAVPGCWLYILHATWPTFEPSTFWRTYGYIFILETALAGALIYFSRTNAAWRGTLVFSLHYVFWILLIVHEGRFLAS